MKSKLINRIFVVALGAALAGPADLGAATLLQYGDTTIQATTEDGNLMIEGSLFTMDSNSSLGGVTFQYFEQGTPLAATFSTIANDDGPAAWYWGYSDSANGMISQMTLDSENALTIHAPSSADDIVLDPGDGVTTGPSILIGGAEVATADNAATLLAAEFVALQPNQSFLMEGAVGGTDPIPVEGAGTRMMWYPEMAAFRAGDVTGTQWDDLNVGGYSAAFGQDTLAYGGWSVAMGHGAQAIGDRSLAVGNISTIASGISSVALGDYSTAQGDNSFAIGGGAAKGLRSFAHGAAIANGLYSVASGIFNTVDGMGGFASGVGLQMASSASWSASFGTFNEIHGANSFSAGSSLYLGTYAETVLGCYNQPPNSPNIDVWVYDDPLFTLGNGISSGDLSNAIVTLKNGKTTLTNKQWLAAWDQDPASALDDPGPADDDSDGDALIVEGHARFKGKVIIDEPQGDISMGIFGE